MKQTATGEATAKSEQAPVVFQWGRGQVHIPPWAFPIPASALSIFEWSPHPIIFLLVSCKISNIHLQPPTTVNKNTRAPQNLPEIPITPTKNHGFPPPKTQQGGAHHLNFMFVGSQPPLAVDISTQQMLQASIHRFRDMLVKSSTSTFSSPMEIPWKFPWKSPWKSPGNPLEIPMESPIQSHPWHPQLESASSSVTRMATEGAKASESGVEAEVVGAAVPWRNGAGWGWGRWHGDGMDVVET